MGLIATVYRSVMTQLADGSAFMNDATNYGWSSRFNTVCVVNVPGPFEPRDGVPGVVLVRHRTMKHVYAVSVNDHEKGLWTMMGGNFLHTSDSRFGETVRKLLDDPTAFVGAVPIHDRKE